MKKVMALLLAISLFALCGCAKKQSDTKPITDADARQMLPKIFQEAEFTDEGGNATTLNKYFVDGDKKFEADKLAYVDLDGDKIIELAVLGDDQTGYLLFKLENDRKIYSHHLVYRAFTELKTDGTFSGSSGADNSTVSKIAFDKTKSTLTDICVLNGAEKIYTVDGKAVSRDEAEKYLNEWMKREKVAWTSLSGSSQTVDINTFSKTISSGNHFKITAGEEAKGYYCVIKDTSGNVMYESYVADKVTAEEKDGIVSLQIDSGNVTGISFYDTNSGLSSPSFTTPVAYTDKIIACYETKENRPILVVRDIFDNNGMRREFDLDFSDKIFETHYKGTFGKDNKSLAFKYLDKNDKEIEFNLIID